MSKFNYVTGYLPYVIDEEIHRKKTKQRVIFSLTALTTGFVVFSFLGNNTSAQSNQTDSVPESFITISAEKPVKDVNPLRLAAIAAVKEKVAIETVQGQAILSLTPVSKQTNEQADTSNKAMESAQALEETYEKEVENILTKAFSQ